MDYVKWFYKSKKYYNKNKSLSENYVVYDYVVNKIENRKKKKNNTLKMYILFCKNEIKVANDLLKNKKYTEYPIDYNYVKCISRVKSFFDDDIIFV